MKHFVECCRKGETPRETYHDGYVVNVILEAAYRSSESHRWESIDDIV
jgi:predicted dehydrogenase